MMKRHYFLIIIAFIFISFNQASATIYYVRTNGSDNNNGLSWGTAFQTLQKATEVANNNDQVWVAGGVYKPTKDETGNLNPANPRKKTFYLTKNTLFFGGFAGWESSLAQRDLNTTITILSGDIDNNDAAVPATDASQIVGNNVYHIIKVQLLAEPQLNGFTISGGLANGAGVDSQGGGLYISSEDDLNIGFTSFAIRFCNFMGNNATQGGALYLELPMSGGFTPRIEDCIFSGNTAGGGLISGSGGAIFSDEVHFGFLRCQFIFNRALGLLPHGGAAFAGGAAPNFSLCSFIGNQAVGITGSGGAVSNGSTGGDTGLFNCLFYQNVATVGSVFYGSGIPQISGITAGGNSAISGTIAAAGPITAWNSIFWGNTGGTYANAGSTLNLNNCIIQEASCPTGANCDGGTQALFGQDPQFVDIFNGNMRLTHCSPAREIGNTNNFFSNFIPTTDLDGLPRFVNQLDLGAYENQGPPPVPMAICANPIYTIDANGSNISIQASSLNNGSTACTALNFTINGQSSITLGCANIGVNTVTLTATDQNGQSSTCTSQISIVDNTPPVLTCPPTQNRNVQTNTCTYTIQGTEFNPSNMTDNCGVTSFSNNLNLSTSLNGVSLGLGTHSITWSANDAGNLLGQCQVTINVVDNQAPSISCPPAFSTRFTDPGTCIYLIKGTEFDYSGATDNCGVNSVFSSSYFNVSTLNNVPLFIGGNTMTWDIVDNAGLSSSCTFTISVMDGQNPSITCPTSTTITRNTDPGTCTYTVQGNELDYTGATDNCGILSVSSIYSGPNSLSGTVFQEGTLTISWTAIDVNNMSSTCSFFLNIVDNQAPSFNCPSGNQIRTGIPGACKYTTQGTEFDPSNAFDNCGVLSITNNINNGSSLNGFEFSGGTTSVIWTILDIHSNQNQCTFNVVVPDAEAPSTPVCPGNIISSMENGLCGATVNWNEPAPSNDNCDPNPILNRTGPSSGSFFTEGTTTISYYATDATGNQSASCSFTVTIQADKEAPVLQGCPGNITVNTDSGQCGATVTWQVPTATDNCTANPTINRSGFASGSFFNLGSNSISYTATDQEGNTSLACTFSVFVTDNTGPNAICQNTTLTLDNQGLGSISINDINNGSSDPCGISSMSLNQTDFNCSDIQNNPNQVILTVTDNNNNVSTCSAEVTLVDNTSPTAMCKNANVQLNEQGIAVLNTSDIDNGSNDVCGSVSLNLSKTSFNCLDIQNNPNQVTLTVTDNSNNTSTCTADVTVIDNVMPNAICQNHTLQLNDQGIGSISSNDIDNGSNDACGIQSLVLNITDFDCNDVQNNPNQVTLTVTDIHNNVNTCTAEVTVIDNVSPNAICQNHTLQLNDQGLGSISPSDIDNGSNDACGIQSLILDITDFDCDDIQNNPNQVTLTVIDNNNNSSTCTSEITVVDNVLPTALCQNHTLQLDNLGMGTVTTNDINNGSNDACGIASLNLDLTNFDCSDIQNNPQIVTLSVTDNNNNTSTCSAEVTVVDNILPIALCKDKTVLLNDQGTGSITTSDIDNGSNDACGIQSLSLNLMDFDCDDALNNTHQVTLTVTDNYNNSSTCTGNVTVLDQIIPTAICQDLTIQLDVNGNASITADQMDNGSNDNCSIVNKTLSKYDFDCSNVGTNTVILTVYDPSNNNHSCTSNITAEDNLAPNAVCQTTTVNLDENGEGTLSPNMIDGGSTDACGIANYAVSQTDFNCSHLGSNLVTLNLVDNNGNTASCQVSITVADPIPALIFCRPPIHTISDPGICGKSDLIMLSPIVLEENCSVTDIINNAPSTFPLGTTVVTWFVTDAGGNISTCDQNVMITDFTPPQIACGNTFIASVTEDQCSFPNYLLEPASATDNCGNVTISNNAPLFFEIGNHEVTWVATDDHGNAAVCTQSVKIWDLIPPVFDNCPEVIEVEAENENGAFVNWFEITATDNCGTVTLVSDFESGDFFPLGETEVSILAYDGFGAPSECLFTVSVTPNEADLSLQCLDYLEVSIENEEEWETVLWTPPLMASECEDCKIFESDNFNYIGNFLGHQYYIFEASEMTWQEAQAYAATWSSNLVILNSTQEQQFLHHNLSEGSYFLGLNNNNLSGAFHWLDGEPADEALFEEGLLNSAPAGSTIILNEEGEWEVVPLFGTTAYFVFEFECIDVQMEIVTEDESTFPAPNSEAQVYYQITDICGNTTFCGFDLYLSSENVAYCEEGSLIENGEDQSWIDEFAFGDFQNASGNDNGYGDYTNNIISANGGTTISIGAKIFNIQEDIKHFTRIWIDFNQDGDFYDENELVLEHIGEGNLEDNLLIPIFENPIQTRLRIATSNQFLPEPCGLFSNGEVEDYTLFIEKEEDNNSNQNLQIFPNPANQYAFVNMEAFRNKKANIRIFNSIGQTMFSKEIVEVSSPLLKLDLNRFKEGIYFLNLEIEGQKSKTERIVVSKAGYALD